MQAALALLPCLAVCVVVLALGWSGLAAALLSAAVALALWAAEIFQRVEPADLARALADAGVLTLLVAGMIVPGIMFIEAIRRLEAPRAIARLVDALALPPARAALLIACSIGIFVESLTGMGVSLLVTVPLLLAIADRRRAIALALVGMSLMPWGALAISGFVGAALSGLDMASFARSVFVQSGPVAAVLPLIAIWLMPSWAAGDLALAMLTGLVLAGTIGIVSEAIGIEAAGVAGAIAVGLVVAGRNIGPKVRHRLADRGLRPYLVLMLAMLAQKLVVVVLGHLGVTPQISTGRVGFMVLASPGVALLAATLASASRQLDRSLLGAIAARAWRPLASIAVFMVTARLLVECGAIAALARAVAGLGTSAAIVAVAFLGAAGGFITGSGVTGNALFMPGAAAVGEALGDVPLLAALQNGASGHAAIASLPIAAILLAALPDRTDDDDRRALQAGLALTACHLAVLITVALLRVSLGV